MNGDVPPARHDPVAGSRRLARERDPERLKVLAELTLALVLFTDASGADLGVLRQVRRLPVRLVAIGLPLTIALGFGVGELLFGALSVFEVALIATMLAPTDAALGKAVVTNEAVPDSIRQGLNVESGLNDGICVPILFLALATGQGGGEGPWQMGLQLFAKAVGIGVVVGVVLTGVAVWLLPLGHRRGWLSPTWQKITIIALAFACFGTSQAAARHVAASDVDLAVPVFVPTADGETVATTGSGDATTHTRLLRFVDGVPWGDLPGRDVGLLEDLGRRLAALTSVFASFSDPAASRTHQWDLVAAGRHRRTVPLIDDRNRRRTAEWLFHLWAAAARPRLDACPAALIHGDANDENVLVDAGRIVGLLDFGDCLHGPVVCELAIALAYVMMHEDEPLDAGARVVGAYHGVRPLARVELEVLFPLICGRLATSVTIAARRRREDPARSSWFATEDRAWRLAERLASLTPRAAGATLAAATGVAVFDDPGLPLDALLDERRDRIGPSLSIAYDRPIKMVRGRRQYLHDADERPFLDLVNNVCHVGHSHPHVVEAAHRQWQRLNTNTRYVYDGLTDYARRLCDTLPAPLAVCYLVNSGSEANELALRLARAHTGRGDVVVLDGAYHGHTGTLVDLSPYKFMGAGGSGRPEPWVHVAPLPDAYRGTFRGAGRDVGVAYGDAVGRIVRDSESPVAAFLVESLSSCGGQIIPPDGYLETAFGHVRAAGGLCIVDEVQVGFGRVGTHFWGFELQGVVPDVVVLGKPIGNGHPLGAVVTTAEIAASFANGMEFFSTFGGNPVSCAVGNAVLDVIEREGLQDHARRVGDRLHDGLSELGTRHRLVGDVRGRGLFIGVELVRDRETLEPAPREAAEVVNRLRDRGVLLSTDGPFHNVLKIKPPLVIDEQDADLVVRLLDDALAEEASDLAPRLPEWVTAG